MNIKCEKTNEALNVASFKHFTSEQFNQWIVMSGKVQRGNTVDTKREFAFAKHHIGNLHD